MTPPPIVTIYDIAERSGLSKSTVARALRGHPNVRPATRALVKRFASELGYRTDSSFAALARYRSKETVVRDMPLAYLYFNQLRSDPPFELRADGGYLKAHTRAIELGYRLIPVELGAFDSAAALNRHLQSLDTRGLLIHSFHSEQSLDLEWDRFACVFVGPANRFSALDSVAPNFADAVKLAALKALQQGYRRVGFALLFHNSAGTDETFRAAALFHSESIERQFGPQPALFDFRGPADCASFRVWLNREQPDVVISSGILPFYFLTYPAGFGESDPIAVPEQVAYINLRACVRATEKHITTVNINEHLLGRTAIEILHDHIQYHRLGLPDYPARHLIPVSWHPGATLPAAQQTPP